MSLALFRRKNESQALIQAPSMDLIRPDGELTIPETHIPTCMDPGEFKAYKALTDRNFDNSSFISEEVLQILAALDIRLYPTEKVEELLEKQRKYYQQNIDKTARKVLWRSTTGNCKYENPIPPKIIKLMKQLQRESGYRYFKGNYDLAGRFLISDIANDGNGRIFAKNRSLICFLEIELFTTNGYCLSAYDSQHFYIIDAWRGPTFSDEEAKI